MEHTLNWSNCTHLFRNNFTPFRRTFFACGEGEIKFTVLWCAQSSIAPSSTH